MRWSTILGLAGWLAVEHAGVACATEAPAYSTVQTEGELGFVSQQLGLANQIAALQSRSGGAVRVDYAMVDLDGDGTGEIFIRLVAGEACTPGQCQVVVFNQTQGRWAKVLEATGPAVTIAKQTHRGYRDILVGAQPWSWNGKAYQLSR